MMDSNSHKTNTEGHEDMMSIARSQIESNELVEVRILGTGKGVVVGWFDDPEALVREVHRSERETPGKGIYYSLNKLKPDRFTEGRNQLRAHTVRTTRGDDIESIRKILFDCDPVRPSDTSSTDAELKLANDLSEKIQYFLCEELGWPQPLQIMSGNGYHLVFGVDLPNSPETQNLIRDVLTSLDAMFSTEKCHVDTSVHDPSRISKLPGTMVRKGKNTPERPHRRSRIIRRPEKLDVVSSKHLEELSANKPTSGNGSVDIRAFVGDYLAPAFITKEKILSNGGILHELSQCPFNPQHKRTARIIQFPNEAISFGCFHNSCQVNGWNELIQHVGFHPTMEREPTGSAKVRKMLQRIAEGDDYVIDTTEVAFVTFQKGDRYVTTEVGSRQHKDYLTAMVGRELGEYPGHNTIENFTKSLAAGIRFEGQYGRVYLRSALCDGNLYIDLCNDLGQCVEITKDDWKVITNPPVKFIRRTGMLPLPVPQRGGSVEHLCRVINIDPDSDEFKLLTSWIMDSYMSSQPHPVLFIDGPEGSGKSWLQTIIRRTVDPNTVPIRGQLGKRDALLAAAWNSAVISFNNVGTLSKDFCNDLCQLATEGGFSDRQYYTQTDEFLFEGTRPIMINGIEAIPAAHDFLGRCIVLRLKRIDEEEHVTYDELGKLFDQLAPGILGDIFSAISCGLRNLNEVDSKQPRMAEFARFSKAAELYLPWESGQFDTAYRRNRIETREDAIMDDPVAEVLLQILHREGHIPPTRCTELLARLHYESPGERGFPGSAASLGRHLSEITVSMKFAGITALRGRIGKKRSWEFWLDDQASEAQYEPTTGSQPIPISLDTPEYMEVR